MRVLYLAPQATLPPLDGADNRCWHLYESLVKRGMSGCFLGRTVLVNELGRAQRHSPARSWRDRKELTALAALMAGRDYWQLKHLLPGAKRAAAQLARESFDVVIVSMLYSLTLASAFLARAVPVAIDTHNFDPDWFGALAIRSNNLALRLLCQRAIKNAYRILASLPSTALLVHVSRHDAMRYRQLRPDLTHVVVENGTTIRPRSVNLDYTAPGRRQLLFVGSLSTVMNQQALQYFACRFWPKIREHALLRVVGSRPSRSISKLCVQYGWELLPNASAEQLELVYDQAHFAILPFEYGEGSKLKLLEACGRAVPVLTTEAGLCGLPHAPPLATVSNEPGVWLERLRAGRQPGAAELRALVAFAEQFSWSKVSDKLAESLESARAGLGPTQVAARDSVSVIC